jgi:hypothetical protein
MSQIGFKAGNIPGYAGGAKDAYEAMKARVAAEITEKIPGIRSDADFRNIIEPQLPKPSDDPKTAAYKVRQFEGLLRSRMPATPITDTYFGKAKAQPQKGGASGAWDQSSYQKMSDQEIENLSDEELQKIFDQIRGQ